MSETVYVAEVRSNIDALSAAALHAALFVMVEKTSVEAGDFLRGVVPKREGLLAEHAKNHVEEIVGSIEARIGVEAIEEEHLASPGGDYDRAHYPIFVDEGTRSPIFAKTASVLHWQEAGQDIFRHSVSGQHGQHFMAATEVFAWATLHHDRSISDALEAMAADAAAMALEMQR